MINSVEEIDHGILAEGFEEMMNDPIIKSEWEAECEQRVYFKRLERLSDNGYGYWLDNCGDDEWYCQHCLQPECGKRMAPLH